MEISPEWSQEDSFWKTCVPIFPVKNLQKVVSGNPVIFQENICSI